MIKRRVMSWMKGLCIGFAIIGIISIGLGFSKQNNYKYPDSEYSFDDESVNAYVGGDAYNYIINGTYFTAYAVMGTGSLIIATITGSLGAYLYIKVEEEKVKILKEEKLHL